MQPGKIKKEWYENSLQNGTHQDIENWFSAQQNCDCEIDATLSVWAETNWLDQERIDDICRRIDEE